MAPILCNEKASFRSRGLVQLCSRWKSTMLVECACSHCIMWIFNRHAVRLNGTFNLPVACVVCLWFAMGCLLSYPVPCFLPSCPWDGPYAHYNPILNIDSSYYCLRVPTDTINTTSRCLDDHPVNLSLHKSLGQKLHMSTHLTFCCCPQHRGPTCINIA